MSCDNMVGVKNIIISFTHCETGEVVKNISHKQANDELPTFRHCNWVNEAMTNGFTRRTASNANMSFSVIRDKRIPLGWYQGCASVDVQIEMLSGIVYTGVAGSVTGEDGSDSHEVQMDVTFVELDEMLPDGQLVAA